MDFGLYIRPAGTYPAMLELARYAEELGLFGVFINDHFEGLSGDRKEPYLEAWTAMAGIGVETKKIRVGHITLFNSMRNPAVLAKMITTLDNMTGGRYETIIGAGWNEPEYLGYDLMGGGIGMPEAGERVTRLKETVQILRGMFDNEVFSYEGKYWTLKDAVNVPRTVQRPMRLSVGARQHRMISIAAKYADGMNGSGNMNAIKDYLKILEPELTKNSRKMRDFYLHGFATVTPTKNKAETDALLQKIAKDKPVSEVAEDAFVGTPDVLVEKLRTCRDLGMKMIIVIPRSGKLPEIKETCAVLRDEVFRRL
ncbi:MAG: LLM class flavin-dependent oxidoreductase [Candidatus Bathyarchaeota archaeon]|nr:LLM class flavin-dependent oxidoreductase [Candidatus Bathyarchaeota archaeon]